MNAALQIASLMYHEVTEDQAGTGFQRPAARRYTLTPAAFAAHLDRIAAGPLAPTLVTRVDFAHPGAHLLLTFDDGGKSALQAGEALARRGWRGHFFIVTSRIGERTFLSAAQIRDLRSAGHQIGSHSHTHPDIFRGLSPPRMLAEWRQSAETLESILAEPCIMASVPGGDSSLQTFETAACAGFRYLFTSEPWLRPRMTSGCWVLGRYGLKRSTPAATVDALVRLRGWTLAKWQRRVKEWLRVGGAPLYRWYVRRATRPITVSSR